MYALYKFIETIKIPIPILKINSIKKFECYHILWTSTSINLNKIDHIHELFKTNKKSLPYTCFSDKSDIFYIGPSFTRKTPWSSNVQQIINNANINEIKSQFSFYWYHFLNRYL